MKAIDVKPGMTVEGRVVQRVDIREGFIVLVFPNDFGLARWAGQEVEVSCG